jgi:hypothetical protein
VCVRRFTITRSEGVIEMNEYDRRGLAGVMHDHALATVVTVMLAWVVAVCAIVTSFGSLF